MKGILEDNRITSKFTNSEVNMYFSTISNIMNDICASTDIILFANMMQPLSAVLSSFDQKLGNSYPEIDENTQDPTYFMVTYIDTKSIGEAFWVYSTVRLLTRYILFVDKLFETGDERYSMVAGQIRESLKNNLHSGDGAQYLVYSIDYMLDQFSAFWKFEQVVKHRLMENNTFSYTEIRHFNLSKSSDASLIYAKVLEAKLPSYNENVGLALHYNQALLDILDDWEDIEDDVNADMPNVFVMAASRNITYDKIKTSGMELVRRVVLNGAARSGAPICRLINELDSLSKSISLPDAYAFTRSLAECYANTLRSKLANT